MTMASMKTAMSTAKPFKWIRPEVSPLFAFIGIALSAGAYLGARHIIGNPTVYVSKKRRSKLGDASDDQVLKEKGRSYMNTSAFQRLANVHGTPDAWRDMQERQEAAAATSTAKTS